jgi:hypothetical protein
MVVKVYLLLLRTHCQHRLLTCCLLGQQNERHSPKDLLGKRKGYKLDAYAIWNRSQG